MIYKERASALFGTPLIAHLQQSRIDSLIICGETTSGCVRASTVALKAAVKTQKALLDIKV